MKHLFCLLVLFQLHAVCIGQNSLIAYYPFNGNANDASGNNINASINKGVPAPDRFGNPNSAYWFGGDSNTYIQIPHSNKLNLSHSKTVSAWYRIDSFPVNYYPSIVYKEGKNYSFPTFGLQFNNDPSYPFNQRYKISFFFGNGSINKQVPTKETYLNPSELTKWVHIAATYSSVSGYQKIYYNGVLSDSAYVGSFTSDTSTKPMQIGRSTAANNFAGNYFKGYIDDIRIYGSALTQTEITEIYLEEDPNCGLVAYYPFNGNANDSSNNALHASINTAIPTADRFGNPNSAYKFLGDSTTFIQVPSNKKLNLSGSKSISAWYKLDSLPTQMYPAILYKEGPNYFYSTFCLQLNNDPAYATKDRYKIGFSFGKNSVNKLISTTQSFKNYINSWIHIAATYSTQTGYQKIYFNGVLSDSTYIGAYLADTSSKPMQIGRSNENLNYYGNRFKGDIDDIRIYCYELSSSEVSDLYTDSTHSISTKVISPQYDFKNVVIYPNPASSVLNIKNIEPATTATIYDITGKKCLTKFFNDEFDSVDISSLENGVYTITLSNLNYIYSQKIIINHLTQ